MCLCVGVSVSAFLPCKLPVLADDINREREETQADRYRHWCHWREWGELFTKVTNIHTMRQMCAALNDAWKLVKSMITKEEISDSDYCVDYIKRAVNGAGNRGCQLVNVSGEENRSITTDAAKHWFCLHLGCRKCGQNCCAIAGNNIICRKHNTHQRHHFSFGGHWRQQLYPVTNWRPHRQQQSKKQWSDHCSFLRHFTMLIAPITASSLAFSFSPSFFPSFPPLPLIDSSLKRFCTGEANGMHDSFFV